MSGFNNASKVVFHTPLLFPSATKLGSQVWFVHYVRRWVEMEESISLTIVSENFLYWSTQSSEETSILKTNKVTKN